jgi:hypothetical protein
VRSWYKGSDLAHIKHHYRNYRAEYFEQSDIPNNHSTIQDAANERLHFCYHLGQHSGYDACQPALLRGQQLSRALVSG